MGNYLNTIKNTSSNILMEIFARGRNNKNKQPVVVDPSPAPANETMPDAVPPTPQTKDMTSHYIDGLAVSAFVVFILTIAGMLSFFVYLQFKKDVDARNHPYH